MKKYLNINNPIMRGLSRVADCLFLIVLWLVFSLPVITIGASSTALYTTVYRYIRRGEGYLWRTFWEAFKESFKRATGCWIIILTALVLLFFDSLVFRNMLKQEKPLGSLYWVILCFMAIVCAWAQYLFAVLLAVLEILAYYRICDLIDKMELWPSLIQVYKRVILVPLAVLFLFAVMELGRPRGFRRIMREIEKIPGILNGDNEAPVLISRRKNKGKKTERWIFDSYGRPYSYFRKLQKEIESALDVGIIRIEEGRDGHKVEIVLAVHPGPWPKMVPWEDRNLKESYSKLPLGVNRFETVFLDLSVIAHAIINGRTGSGKTIAMKSLCYGAIMKGYEVSLVDFKGGVDYGPVWERHARLISDNQEFLAAIRELVEEKEAVDLITQGLNTLCRLGRAVGISCVLSTQRGSADLISGQIRNNALKIVGQWDENLSLLTIGITDAATVLSHPGQFMDENKNVFQGFYADNTALLKKQESGLPRII